MKSKGIRVGINNNRASLAVGMSAAMSPQPSLADLSSSIKRKINHLDKLIATVDRVISGRASKEDQKLADSSVVGLLSHSSDRLDTLISRLEDLVSSVVPADEIAEDQSEETSD